jgi:hypothetical protein
MPAKKKSSAKKSKSSPKKKADLPSRRNWPTGHNERDRQGPCVSAGLFFEICAPSGIRACRWQALTKLLLHVRVAKVQMRETLLGRFFRPRHLPLFS